MRSAVVAVVTAPAVAAATVAVAVAVAAAAAGSGPHQCEDIPLAQESPIPGWSYSHRSSPGRVPHVGVICHHVERTPAQASP